MRVTAVARGRGREGTIALFVKGCAQAVDVTGCVENQLDGSMLLVAERERAALDAFVQRVKVKGDTVIRVDSLA